MVDWKEHDHKDVDTQEMNDPNCLNALRNCGLLKFFLTPRMRAQLELLSYLISLWDINREILIICDQESKLETSEIYFITALSRRGEPVILYGSRPIRASISMLLAKHCPEALKSNSGKIEIATVRDLTLRVLLLTINKVVGPQAVHETNKSKFIYAIDYTAPMIFNWVEAVKINIKCQLTKAKMGNLKQFCFGFVLVTFSLERILLFQYQLTEVDLMMPRDPWMARRSRLMPRITGGQHMSYRPAFFSWLRQQLIVVDDWPFSGTDFHGDPNMPLPDGEDFNAEGKNSIFLIL